MLLDDNIPNGPITTDRELDDGTKRNLYSMIRSNDDSFYYKYDEFNRLDEIISKKPEYICEDYSRIRPEAQKGHDIACPRYYTIKIDKAFYGRYANDTQHCSNIQFTPSVMSKIREDCGRNIIKNIKEKCEGKVYCSLIPRNLFYGDSCGGVYKYLHIEYRCIKDSVKNFIF